MKKAKKLFSILFMLAILGTTCGTAASEVISNEYEEFTGQVYVESLQAEEQEAKESVLLSDIGTISVKEKLTLDNQEFLLYPTFDDPITSLEEISVDCSSVLDLLSEEYALPDLSQESWEDYYTAMYAIFNSESCPDWYSESNLEFRKLRSFFDIYENDQKNAEIAGLAQEASVRSVSDKNIANIIETLMYMLPYTSVSDANSIMQLKVNLRDFDVDDGIDYAVTWAEDRNTDEYYSFSDGDCANFASQILEAGGVQQDESDDDDVNEGWWHKVSKIIGLIPRHTHSLSWTMAHDFYIYMGPDLATTSHEYFSEQIEPGDFIAIDYELDRDFDHIGFVTDKKSYKTNGYYDYEVAQHSTDYLLWTSHAKNGWEYIGEDGGWYGIVHP